MKTFLLILLFSQIFGQTEITTKEYIININRGDCQIDFSQYTENLDGIYEVKFIYFKFNFENQDTSQSNYLEFEVWDEFDGLVSFQDFYMACSYSLENKAVCQFGGNYLYLNDENSIFNPEICESAGNWSDGDLYVRITGNFTNDGLGINGDVNGDNELNVVDIVMLVQTILEGNSTGSIFELINEISG